MQHHKIITKKRSKPTVSRKLPYFTVTDHSIFVQKFFLSRLNYFLFFPTFLQFKIFSNFFTSM